MMKPLGARALVKRMEAPKLDSQLIVVPDTVEQQASQYAVVMAIGTLVHGGFDAGDVVILAAYAGAPCQTELDGEMIEALIVEEAAVLAVVE